MDHVFSASMSQKTVMIFIIIKEIEMLALIFN